LMRGKRLPHLVAFSKSVAADARAANASSVDMVRNFMAEVGDDGVAVFGFE
jgi:hypothetical protein